MGGREGERERGREEGGGRREGGGGGECTCSHICSGRRSVDTYTIQVHVCIQSCLGSRGQRAGVVRPWGWDLGAGVV